MALALALAPAPLATGTKQSVSCHFGPAEPALRQASPTHKHSHTTPHLHQCSITIPAQHEVAPGMETAHSAHDYPSSVIHRARPSQPIRSSHRHDKASLVSQIGHQPAFRDHRRETSQNTLRMPFVASAAGLNASSVLGTPYSVLRNNIVIQCFARSTLLLTRTALVDIPAFMVNPQKRPTAMHHRPSTNDGPWQANTPSAVLRRLSTTREANPAAI